MSMLDRPISEFDGPVDAVRVPVVPPTGAVQAVPGGADRTRRSPEVAGLRQRRRQPQVPRLPRFHRQLRDRAGSGIGFLAGWRGKGGEKFMQGEPNPRQWEMYAKNNCVFQHKLPPSYQYMRNWNKGYHEWAQTGAPAPPRRPDRDPDLLRGPAEIPPGGAGQRAGQAAPAAAPGERVDTYFDPLPFWYAPLEAQVTDAHKYPLNAITQRPMAMYHSWDSQNAWLRQIHAHNYLFVNPARPRARRASPTATGSGSSRCGARCAAWRATPRRWNRARCGPGTRSARRPAPGTSRPAPTKPSAASCSTT